MKAAREHRVPLSREAVAVLKQMQALRHADLVFPGNRRGKPLSNMSMLMMLRRMGRSDLTAHGFRSTFRDWAAECTNFPREVAESVLAHVVGDRTEAAYRRGDLFEKRRRLMDAWAAHCLAPPRCERTVIALNDSMAQRLIRACPELNIEITLLDWRRDESIATQSAAPR
jgi:hypothetical protein